MKEGRETKKIKGRISGKGALETRWSRRLVMSEDKAGLEITHEGEYVDITVGLAMACPSGFNAAEALAAISSKCRPCGESLVGVSRVILMDVLYEGLVYWCRQCYSDNCRSDPDDA